jgi:CRISPR system Cascade subunit CasE
MSDLWFTRARLRRSGSAAALAPLLAQPGRLDQGHAVVWSLFADAPSRRRDFLWRETERGLFYLLSARMPVDAHQLFDMDPPKSFSPSLTAGCRLRFSLHANPVVRRGTAEARPGGKGHRVRKDDVVMNAIKPFPKGERAAARFDAIGESGLAWLRTQGEKAGFLFDPGEVAVEGYTEAEVRRRDSRPIRFHTIDFDGRLTVTDPATFTTALTKGFGSARAFGCGLMLIRRG